ncbi:MAG TPA: hypothetical protein VGC41_04560 [Kofleriaceae bacterium]
MAATRDDIRQLFENHGEPDVFDWVEEVLDRIDQRAETHPDEPKAVAEILVGDQTVEDVKLPSPYIYIVDGSLRGRNLDFGTDVYEQSLVIVMGDVEAVNFKFDSGANVFIKGDLKLRGALFGHHGDGGADLYCQMLRARAVLLDHVTGLNAREIDAVVCSAEGWGLPMHVDYNGAGHAELFVPEILDEGSLRIEPAWAHATAGGDVFLPGAWEKLRATQIEPL